MDTIKLVEIAFRKLKASVYFDKTMLPLRDKVVEFETNQNFKANIVAIANALDNNTLDVGANIVNEIVSKISALPFPKKMKAEDANLEKNVVIGVGIPDEVPVVSDLQWFIDMDVQGHILGILWIMAFGQQLDELCYEHSCGNRLRSNMIWDEDDGCDNVSESWRNVKDSPALFEPYFAQYSLWRDGGLSCAEKALANKQDVLIITLDLKRFYYNAGISKSAFDKLLSDDSDMVKKQLHVVVFKIIEQYTQVLDKQNAKHSGNVLPIGFLPSAVLANWCLSKFDNGILDTWNPLYYGRYVDDIIIVEKIEKGSEIYKKAHENQLTNDFVIEYYLGKERNHSKSHFITTKKNECYVDKQFCLSSDSILLFQNDKTRIIALFERNNSTAIINKFKQEMYTNVSEFRLMPELGEAFSQDDFSQFYRLDNDATVNKLRGVKGISIDKYELSKFLGKYRVVSSLTNDGSSNKFTKIIGKMFNNSELVGNYIFWERILEIFITDKDYIGFSKFVKKMNNAVKSIEVENNKKESVKKSLKSHLEATLNRVLSLLYGSDFEKIDKAITNLSFSLSLRDKYVATKMSNKYITAIPIETFGNPPECKDDNLTVNLTDFTDAWGCITKNVIKQSNKCEFLPYFQQAQDIAIASLLSDIDNYCLNGQYIKTLSDKFSSQVKSFETKRNNGLGISVGDQKFTKNKLRIAVANVSVDEQNLKNLLSGKKPNRHYLRYKALADIVNTAIKEDADMLILPENYVPFEWLSPLAAKSAKDGLAIITGVEHIINTKNVFNYTTIILPFKYQNSIPTASIFFQLKKHYSPEEKRLIVEYGFNVPDTSSNSNLHPLYRWKDCYFPVYCCYELSAINDRIQYTSWADMIVAVECNKDTIYFSNIIESLTRDLHCYCVQVNTSQYGDSRIIQPTKSEERNILSVKGGLNRTLLIGEIDIKGLREFQIKKYDLQREDGKFKPTPPDIDVSVVRKKIRHNI
jgi:hypothetical protein